MASTRPHDAEDLHFRVLKKLETQPDLSQRELADQLGVSNGKLHYCIRALIDAGLIKLGNFAGSQHRLRYAYLLTPAGVAQKAGMTRLFLKRKIAEYEALKAEIAALHADLPTSRPSQDFEQSSSWTGRSNET
jgi:EPS-associated MarR family transcriptional regulator